MFLNFRVYQELKECVIPHQMSCSKVPEIMLSVGQMIETYDKMCPEVLDKENDEGRM